MVGPAIPSLTVITSRCSLRKLSTLFWKPVIRQSGKATVADCIAAASLDLEAVKSLHSRQLILLTPPG
jgi:hypothetical protein